ncbi:MAG: HesB protein family [Caulobacter sp.]|nr:HesB protein family [Caulobacter sp.]
MTEISNPASNAPAFTLAPSGGSAPPLTLSASAAARIRAIGEKEGKALMLRVSVEGGGCSGFQYLFDLVEAGTDEDLRVECDGATALVDDVSLTLLMGSEIDFIDELAGAEFKIRNPNAKSSCGCGVSFSI